MKPNAVQKFFAKVRKQKCFAEEPISGYLCTRPRYHEGNKHMEVDTRGITRKVWEGGERYRH